MAKGIRKFYKVTLWKVVFPINSDKVSYYTAVDYYEAVNEGTVTKLCHNNYPKSL